MKCRDNLRTVATIAAVQLAQVIYVIRGIINRYTYNLATCSMLTILYTYFIVLVVY